MILSFRPSIYPIFFCNIDYNMEFWHFKLQHPPKFGLSTQCYNCGKYGNILWKEHNILSVKMDWLFGQKWQLRALFVRWNCNPVSKMGTSFVGWNEIIFIRTKICDSVTETTETTRNVCHGTITHWKNSTRKYNICARYFAPEDTNTYYEAYCHCVQ